MYVIRFSFPKYPLKSAEFHDISNDFCFIFDPKMYTKCCLFASFSTPKRGQETIADTTWDPDSPLEERSG